MTLACPGPCRTIAGFARVGALCPTSLSPAFATGAGPVEVVDVDVDGERRRYRGPGGVRHEVTVFVDSLQLRFEKVLLEVDRQ